MTTMGDRVLNISLPKIGEKSLFTKDLEDALKIGSVDFVVHSLKDLPTSLPDGMAIGAVLEREDPRDSLVLAKQHEGKCLKTLPEGSIIGKLNLLLYQYCHFTYDLHIYRYIIITTHCSTCEKISSSGGPRHSGKLKYTLK